jgi:hypothetical protein
MILELWLVFRSWTRVVPGHLGKRIFSRTRFAFPKAIHRNPIHRNPPLTLPCLSVFQFKYETFFGKKWRRGIESYFTVERVSLDKDSALTGISHRLWGARIPQDSKHSVLENSSCEKIFWQKILFPWRPFL